MSRKSRKSPETNPARCAPPGARKSGGASRRSVPGRRGRRSSARSRGRTGKAPRRCARRTRRRWTSTTRGNGGFSERRPGARGALDGFWGDIRDRAWAVVAAATVVCDSYETQRVALEKALRETERWISADSADASASRATESTESRNETGPGPSPRDPNERNRVENRGKLENWSWWHRLRLVVLARLDRLDASHASRLGAFKGEAWRRMSAQSAEDAAKSLASRDDARGAVAVARAFPRRRRGRRASAHPGNVFGDHFRRRVRAASALARALERAGVSSASFQRGCCVVDPKPSRVQNRRAQVRERARRRFRRVARRRRGAPTRTRRRRGVRFVRAGARRARERGRARARREPRRHAERDVAVAFDRARPSPPPRRRKRARGGDGAKEFSWRPATSGEPGGDAGWALRRALRCDAAARLRHGRGAARGRGKPRARRRN